VQVRYLRSLGIDEPWQRRTDGMSVTNGLVAWYKFDEGSGTTANDSSGQGNHGTLTNGPSWVSGVLGSALHFGGTNDAVVVPDSNSLDLTNVTIAAWMWVEDNTPSVYIGLASKGGGWGYNGYQLMMNIYGGTRWEVDGVGMYGNVLATGRWQHVASTWDGTTKRVYLDGVLDTSETGGSLTANSLPLGIGRILTPVTEESLVGSLDDVRIYNRALSADEIRDLQQLGATTYLADALGSTLALADGTQAIQTEYDYEPFGTTTASGASSANSYKYTGREEDGTGLYYYRARYYHPGLSRFVSEDPIGFFGGLHLYGYANGNPVNRIDPLGLVGIYDESLKEDVNKLLNDSSFCTSGAREQGGWLVEVAPGQYDIKGLSL